MPDVGFVTRPWVRLLRRALAPPFQPANVGTVLLAARGLLVGHEILGAQHRYSDSLDWSLDSPIPRTVERQPGNPRQDIDPVGRKTELRDHIGSREIAPVDVEIVERRAERRECTPHPLCILVTRFDPDVDIHSRPWVAVDRERMGPDHEETGLFGDESAEDVSVVLVHRLADLYCSPSVDSLTGIVERV